MADPPSNLQPSRYAEHEGLASWRVRRISVNLDDETDAILERVTQPGQENAWVRAAIHEKAARDEYRDELAAVRARLERVEADVKRLKQRG